jgi:hypothetical protein
VQGVIGRYARDCALHKFKLSDFPETKPACRLPPFPYNVLHFDARRQLRWRWSPPSGNI